MGRGLPPNLYVRDPLLRQLLSYSGDGDDKSDADDKGDDNRLFPAGQRWARQGKAGYSGEHQECHYPRH